MADQKRSYNTKKKGPTECYPFYNMEDIKKVMDWFLKREDWDNYFIFMLGILMGRRIGDTISIRWSDLYHENGKIKNEIKTIEEQKTGKMAVITISPYLKKIIDFYIGKKGIDPMEHFEEFIFYYPKRQRWVERKDDKIYKQDRYHPYTNEEWIEKWAKTKDLGQKKKEKILDDFKKQTRYKWMGSFLYNVVEYDDVLKACTDNFRKKLVKAVSDSKIEYHISCHSLRKTFGFWLKQLHPYDINCMETLQDMFCHSSTTETMRYIGLSAEKKRQYYNDIGDFVEDISKGKNSITQNAPVISLKNADLRNIIKIALSPSDDDPIERYNLIMDMIDDVRVKNY